MKVIVVEPGDLSVISKEKIEEIRNRCHAISPSPWVWTMTVSDKGEVSVDIVSAKPGFVGNGKRVAALFGDQAYNNAEFIARAQEDVSYLIDQLEYLLGLFESAIPTAGEGAEVKAN